MARETFCVDCAHARWHLGLLECNHDRATYRPASDFVVQDMKARPQQHSAAHMRSVGGCGSEAIFFQRR